MKQGTSFALPVDFSGVDLSKVSRIEFVFKRANSPAAQAIKTAAYPGDVSQGDEPGRFLVPWTAEETYLVRGGESFWLDTRITMTDTSHQPETPIIQLMMGPTLFAQGEEV